MNSLVCRNPVLAMALLFAACSDSRSEAAYGSTDGWTAPVAVLTGDEINSAPDLELIEEARIGAVDGPDELRHFRVADVALIQDEVWVLDNGDAELRVYGLDGTYRRTIGGRGEGPGEFESPNALEVRGDTVVVIGSNRLTLFGPGDSVLATGPSFIRNADGRSRGLRNAGATWIRDRSPNRTQLRPRDVLLRDTMYLHVGNSLSLEFGVEIFRFATAPNMFAGEAGWGLQPYYTSIPVTAVGGADLLYYAPGDAYRIDIRDASTGAPVYRIASTMEYPPVTREMLDRAWEQEAARLADARPGSESEMYAQVAPRKREFEAPANRPVLGSIHTGPGAGFIVLRLDLDPDPLESGDPSTWDRFGPDRKLTGRFATPGGARVLGFYGDRIAAVERDEFDVQFVTIYRIVEM